MCLLFLYLNPDPSVGPYKLVLASNRDEVYHRPARSLHVWSNDQHGGDRGPTVYGGTDMEPGKEGGTWLAASDRGRIGVLLNIGRGDANALDKDATSGRGSYVAEWVRQDAGGVHDAFDRVRRRVGKGPGHFRLVAVDVPARRFDVLTSPAGGDDGASVDQGEPGFHCLGNEDCGGSWRKAAEGRQHFQSLVQEAQQLQQPSRLLEMLSCKKRRLPDASLSRQMNGRPEKVIECLSSIFVEIPGVYGTRTQSVILIDQQDRCTFYERTMDGVPAMGADVRWIETRLEFPIVGDAGVTCAGSA